MELIKVVAIAMVALIGGLLLRGMRSELSLGLRIGGIVLIFAMVMHGMEELLAFFSDLPTPTAFSAYVNPMMKATGLTFLCKICADICRDCGEGGLANGVESAGKVGVLLLALPMVRELMETALSLWEIGA
ncbi:MAG: stage III sporulation AC/AD family protein [Clostridia bacterium]|nr:stage III sporulation AC/AD family protein [Clostridia bacterium]